MSDSLRLQTLALIGQEFLANALTNGASLDSTIAGMLLNVKPVTSGREKTAFALTGRIRGDAGMMRQAAKNASEGATMATLIKDAGHTLGEKLSEMQTVVQSLRAAQISPADATAAFNSIAQSISATVSGTQYNGISLVDKTAWANDERLTVATNASAATLSIQMGNASSTFTLRDLSSLKDYTSNTLNTMSNADLDALIADISNNIGRVTDLSSGYEAIAGSYTADAKHFENQATLLAATAAKTIYGNQAEGEGSESETVQSILIDFLLRDQGKIVDTSS
jgi:hypothetical protein